jgi:hypothetical protein
VTDFRPPLTDQMISAGVTLSLLQRREQIEEKYPGVQITTGIETASGKWEVYVDGEGAAFYDSASRMLAALEARYPV